jgi:hypothetical protein
MNRVNMITRLTTEMGAINERETTIINTCNSLSMGAWLNGKHRYWELKEGIAKYRKLEDGDTTLNAHHQVKKPIVVKWHMCAHHVHYRGNRNIAKKDCKSLRKM